jgi:hypothetical protein
MKQSIATGIATAAIMVGAMTTFAGPAFAVTFGRSVNSNSSTTDVNTTAAITTSERNALRAAAAGTGATNLQLDNAIIDYFIPLSAGNCTFGIAGCGTSVDTRTAPYTSGEMTMWIYFGGVDGGQSYLNLYFEDLDLFDAADNGGGINNSFLETVKVYDTGPNLAATFTNINDSGISGDNGTQVTGTINLGTLTKDADYWVKLELTAASTLSGNRINTPEYIIAAVSGTPEVDVPEIDAAAGLGSIAALGAMLAFYRGRRRHATA